MYILLIYKYYSYISKVCVGKIHRFQLSKLAKRLDKIFPR